MHGWKFDARFIRLRVSEGVGPNNLETRGWVKRNGVVFSHRCYGSWGVVEKRYGLTGGVSRAIIDLARCNITNISRFLSPSAGPQCNIRVVKSCDNRLCLLNFAPRYCAEE